MLKHACWRLSSNQAHNSLVSWTIPMLHGPQAHSTYHRSCGFSIFSCDVFTYLLPLGFAAVPPPPLTSCTGVDRPNASSSIDLHQHHHVRCSVDVRVYDCKSRPALDEQD